MWFFASTEIEIFDQWILSMGMFVIVHISIVFLFHWIQRIAFLLSYFSLSTSFLKLKTSHSLKIIIFTSDALRTALPNHANFSGRQKTNTMNCQASIGTIALMWDFELWFSVQILLLNVNFIYFIQYLHSYTTDSLWLSERRLGSLSPK